MSEIKGLVLGVSIITCTNRPQFFYNIIKNFRRQLYRVKELIIVLNKDSMVLEKYRRNVRFYTNVSVYKVREKASLGTCLNYGVGKTKYPYIAKFDDDDYYSPYYLKEQMKALHRSGASIVGKHTHMIYLEGKKLLIMRFPKQQNRFVKTVPGGTFLFNRRVFNHVRFADITRAEDMDFLSRCRLRGYKIYTSSPYNFVGIRRKNKQSHTWNARDEILLKGSLIIAKTNRYRKIANRSFK